MILQPSMATMLRKEAGLSEEEALVVIAKYSRDNARTPMQWSAEPGFGL